MEKRISSFILLLFLCFPLISSTASTVMGPKNSFIESHALVFERGPTVNLVSNDTATIFWRTESSENSIVHYGKNSSLLESVTNATLVTDHIIPLESLEMDTKYYYTVESGSDESEMYHFYTAPADGEEFRLVIAGDNRPDGTDHPVQPEIFSELAEKIIEEEPHMVILTGDFVYTVTTTDADNLVAWEYLTNITDHIGHYAPVIGVVGNHDTGVSNGAYQIQYYLDAFMNTGEGKTYFSFDYAGVHFTVLDTEEQAKEGHIIGTQYDWLVEDLNNNTGKMKFVFAHRPLYPVTHVGSALDVNTTERDEIQKLFEETNVTLFGVGHDHTYNRLTVNGVVHIITGGLGAPLYNSAWSTGLYHYMLSTVDAHAVNFSAIKPDGSLYEQYNLPYDGPIEIVDRVIANTSTKRIGTVPFLLFSEKPVTKYFSWDGSANTTEITGLPGPEGEHILDVYAENAEGVWSTARFVFTSYDPDATEPTSTTTTTTTDTTIPDGGIDIVLIFGIVGVVAVIVVIVLVVKMRK